MTLKYLLTHNSTMDLPDYYTRCLYHEMDDSTPLNLGPTKSEDVLDLKSQFVLEILVEHLSGRRRRHQHSDTGEPATRQCA